MKIRANVVVSGKVQGVFLRQAIELKANEIELNGWVKNLKSGKKVEAVFEGLKEQIDEILEFIRSSPANSEVDKVEVDWKPFKGDVKGFRAVH